VLQRLQCDTLLLLLLQATHHACSYHIAAGHASSIDLLACLPHEH